ncbi:UBX domain-containing protein 7 isoform X1 [Leptopilina heterotoma]|uniref:UBX domain-containing protein 7 isoform X1 n=1 Tax=Leptopilina heterotoma TaxID=63436 RepID=UPI001CA8AFE7|nr:UBX domain-containing protein 7 isoform X1 [Leptopilina heterotoma]
MDRSLVEKFIEVTGESEAIATQYLALAEGNVDTAITLLFEGGGPAAAPPPDPEPAVRPPILPTQEVLVPPEIGCSFPRTSNSVFDRFRDFNVETQRQEEEMTRKASGTRKNMQRKTRRLEDLFRPPCEILFLGTFLEAREYAKSMNRWLLVNVQNPQEFACQILNRDVWPNAQIREMIKDHFVLWQVLSNTSEGKRYNDFYNVMSYPYLGVIDPRTGECMRIYNQVTVDSLTSGLNDMLSTHASPECAPQEPSVSDEWKNSSDSSMKRNLVSDSSVSSNSSGVKKLRKLEGRSLGIIDGEATVGVSSTSVSNHSPTILSKRSRIDELDAKSKSSCLGAQKKDETSSKEQDVSCKSESVIDKDAPSLRLCLRLPNGSKETISMNSSERIEDFLKKMQDMGYTMVEYTFLIPFPRTVIEDLSLDLRLADSILFPSNTVFISKI